ncbi:MAG: fibronectin type III domain-containing protein [Firmicutes bacterium]|nr:fibronectin type III domain-containing protein [Bacillota bacterium]
MKKIVLICSAFILALGMSATLAACGNAQAFPHLVGYYTARAAHQSVELSWTTPTAGSSAITKYVVTAAETVSGNSVAGYPKDVAPSNSAIKDATVSHTVTGLTNGVAYTFTVRAHNTQGAGAVATAYATPTNVLHTPVLQISGNTLSWTGVFNVSGYELNFYTGGAFSITLPNTGPATYDLSDVPADMGWNEDGYNEMLAGKTFSIRIKAIAASPYTDSAYSDSVDYTFPML